MKTLKYTIIAVLLTVAMPVLAQDKAAQGCKNMNGCCMAMMDRQKQDAALDQLVAEMNSAPANQKVAAIATVVNKLVQLRKEETNRMAQMMKPMQTGVKKPVAACPMMGNGKKVPMTMPMASPMVSPTLIPGVKPQTE